ncbi:MAG TPA: phosphatase PAP2 family protein [Gemmatimonadaceae bacterium]|nr:phosphatase PAP2 family protein [Gemmatimonadaceae bacterium]
MLSRVLTRVILPFALLAAAMIGLGLLVTHVLVHVWPLTLEGQANQALAAARTPTWNRVSDLVSQTAYIPGLTIAMVVAGFAMRIAYHRWREFLFLAAALVSEHMVYWLTASVVARARPSVPQLDTFPPMRSFPSGHVAAAIAVYCGIALVFAMHATRKWVAVLWWVILLAFPVAVAFSRVYRGEHNPSDVAASFVLGFGCLWILRRAMLTPDGQRG